MKNIVVTIARQYGSGGRTIGRMLAKDLGVPFYDRELLEMASEDSGIHVKFFGAADEKVKTSAKLKGTHVYSGELISPESKDFVSDDNLFNYTAKTIKKLASEQSCVIIGRCADFVLREYPNVASVFIHAPAEFCLEQAMQRNSMNVKDMQKFIERTDKYRGDFYEHYTGHRWADLRNYDLCLNSGKLGFERTVEEIKAYLKVRFGDFETKE